MTAAPDDSPGEVQGSQRLIADARVTSAAESVAGGLALVTSFLSTLSGPASSSGDAARFLLSPLVPALGAAEGHLSSDVECRSCPVCRLLAVMRTASPELVDSIGDALDSVIASLRDELSGGQ